MEEVTSADSPVYRDLMRFKPEGWTANAWAVNAGVSRTVWTDMRRHGNPSRRTLEKLLTAVGSSLAEFEALRIGDAMAPMGDDSPTVSDPTQAWRSATLAPLPLVDSRGGKPVDAGNRLIETLELNAASILDRLPRPAALAEDRDAYAFAIVGEAMWPRFRRGRRVAVSPAATGIAGDDVVATIKDDRPTGLMIVVIGELVAVDAGQVQLRQFNPDGVFSIDADRLVAIHKIVGELI